MTRNDALAEAVELLKAGLQHPPTMFYTRPHTFGEALRTVLAALSPPASETGDAALAEWDDPSVQLVYRLLTDAGEHLPNADEHWEGWVARRIVAALRRTPAADNAEQPERVEQIAQFVADWNGASCNGDTFLIADEIRARFGSTALAIPKPEPTEAMEQAIKALDLAEQISGRHEADDAPTSLTPHGWEYIFSAFDAARAALAASSPGETELREALEPFAREASQWDDSASDATRPIIDSHDGGGVEAEFTVGDLRKARQALARLDATLNGRPG